jgi:hypothetical protein
MLNNKPFRTKLFFLFLLSTPLLANSLSEEALNGKELYLDANCQKCHAQDTKYDAKKKKSKNMANLSMWVKNCDSFFEIAWFPEEQDDVIKYLNEVYYKY